LEFGGDIGWVLRFGWDGFYRVADDSRRGRMFWMIASPAVV
jgi:hypothetical protein